MGEARWLELELKIVADAGIVGVPNAGQIDVVKRHPARPPPKLPTIHSQRLYPT